MFRVGINGLSLLNRSGTGRVVEGLLEGLSRIEVSDIRFDVILPRSTEIRSNWAQAPHLEFHSIGPAGAAYRILWEQLVLSRWVRHQKYRILHSPAFVAPVHGLGETLSVVTVHDLAFLRLPETETVRWERRLYYRWAILSSIQNAQLILTDSEFIRNELVSTGTPDERVKVLPLGVGDQFFSVPENEIRRVRGKYSLPNRYLLTVGTVEPRKNLNTLLSLFERGEDIPPLVIAGRFGWGYRSFQAALRERQARCHVFFLNYVPEEDLPGLYAGADLFLAPSLYEGFGLTVLEAMAAGCRVVASDIPAHREIGGDTTRYVKPADPEAWTVAIRDASDTWDRGPAVDRARGFSWGRHAQEYVEILEGSQ